jgi:glucan-binding YG repeat protein
MKKIILLVFLSGIIYTSWGQEPPTLEDIPIINNNVFQQRTEINELTKDVKNLQYRTNNQIKEIKDLTDKLKNQDNIIDSLSEETKINREDIITNSDELGTKIQETATTTNAKLTDLGSSVGQNRLFWIIGILGLLGLGGLFYVLLGKRIQSNKTDVEQQILNTKAALDEESVKLDGKLVEILGTQLKIIQEERIAQPTSKNSEEDHSLALKVADEIIRIQKNLSKMDSTVKGLKQLNASVKRIQANFAANDYEIVDMLGKVYNEGMKVTANFIPSEDIEIGKEIITRIIKPQVNFKNKMIQAAQIEVSIGE